VINPDPKWLEILKASGWQTTAIAIACSVFLFLSHIGLLPPLPDWATLVVWFIGLICGCLAVASWCSAAYNFFPLHIWYLHYQGIWRAKRGLHKYIPYMTPEEKEIIGYLLAKNQKTFTAAADGGHGATLLSRGIIIVLAQHGQQLDSENIPMTIPDPLWDVFVKRKKEFPYSPPTIGEESHPWRVHWMAR
jgi:hypothetical protein